MARSLSFVIAGRADTRITVTEKPDGTLAFDLAALDGTGKGALRALFFDLEGVTVGPEGLAAIGADVTRYDSGEGSVSSLGRGTSIRGSVTNTLGGFDVGVALAAPGISRDDNHGSSFILDYDHDGDGASDLTLDMVDLADFGLRHGAVGEHGGGRAGPAKIGGRSGGVASNDVLHVVENMSGGTNLLDNDTNGALRKIVGVSTGPPLEFEPPSEGPFDLRDEAGVVYGILTISANGEASVAASGAGSDALAEGQTATLAFGYQSEGLDGSLATAAATVTITGANDAPVLGADSYHFAVDENAEVPTPVGQVVAADVDDGDTVRYSISGPDAQRFAIDGLTGAITARESFDFETAAGYSFTVEARDREAGGLVDTATVTVSVNDLEEAGAIDVVIGGFSSAETARIGVLLGNGDGTLQLPVNYSSGLSTEAEIDSIVSVALGDIDHDGALDLVVGAPGYRAGITGSADSLSVLPGNGDGTFGAATTYSNGSGYRDPGSAFGEPRDREVVWETELVDLDRDGNLDIVAAVEGRALHGLSGDGLSILLGNGDGTFQAANTAPVGQEGHDRSRAVEVADLDGDGRLDVVVATRADNTVGGLVLLRGAGDGTVERTATYTSGIEFAEDEDEHNLALALSDVNNDGALDLVTGGTAVRERDQGTGESLSVRLNNGDGTFGAAATYSNGSGYVFLRDGEVAVVYQRTNDVDLADLDGDGDLDLVASVFGTERHGDSGDGLSVLLGNGDGTFQAASTYSIGGGFEEEGMDAALADFNGDGHLDVGVVNRWDPSAVYILLGNGDGTFQPATAYEDGVGQALGIAVGHLNDDLI